MPERATDDPLIIAYRRAGDDPPDPAELAADAARVLAELESTDRIVTIERTPDDLPNGPVCDFDRAQPVAWTYPCDSFMLPELNWQSITDWAACAACAELIEADDMDGLFARWKAAEVVPPEAEDDPATRERYERSMELVQRTIFEAFMTHRWGERRPYDPDEDHAMPEAIRVLPRDERGLPIPYATLRVDGRPDFRTLDLERVERCIQDRLCGVCGRTLDYWIAFIGGPACERNRLFRDPAMHPQCADYAARACPFISGARTKYSSRPLPEGEGLATHVDVNMADHERRPVDMFIFTTRRYRVVARHGERYIEAARFAQIKRITSR
jgi:hypothetical protein